MAEAESSLEAYSDEVNEEIEALRAIFSAEEEFRIEACDACDEEATESSKSQYLCDITIRPKDLDVALRFSLTASYPETCPRIEIVSSPDNMSADPISRLLVHLYNVAQQNTGGALLYTVVESAIEWIQDHPLEVGEPATRAQDDEDNVSQSQASCDEPYSAKVEKKKEKQSHSDSEKYGKPSKKPPMKTATDVISRIQWDDQLVADHFVVGYLDRFIGIVEQPFNAFYWEDISGVDSHTLAIPRHRIQYFKYKDEIVWDKATRLDNVFGSQGSGVTIVDIVQHYSKENASEAEGFDEKDSDDMDDFEFGACSEHSDRPGDCHVAHATKVGRRRLNKSRPNYFLGIRITDEDIKANVLKIHDHMTSLDPHVTPYLIPPAHLHVTLCMLQLHSESQISNALSVLKSIQDELISLLLPVTILRFQGVDAFHDRVVYIEPLANPAINKLAEHLRTSLSSAGINLTGTREEFVPHLTVMKMPRDEMTEHPIFTSDLRARYQDVDLGCQVVDAIHLCSIEEKPAHDKFYYSIAKIDLVD